MPYYTYYKGKLLDQYLTYYNLLLQFKGKKIKPKILADWEKDIYQKYNPLLDSLCASDVLDKEEPIVAIEKLL
ncbi:hypothetical protein [Bacteroides sp. D2]|uniref:hypothetical protein n=1 Tax=Bacteroides sp. D2 TaxID=556259 RepID=UPI0001BC7D33|nr:hypothetical protein [Bacteroides sp. D2]EFS31330.1 hypothetical protein BSGG_2030 [Bacteroides sp. D2]UWO00376.1 hypothetical protein NQ505_02790 [Bacteroides sp. D2]